MLIPRVKIWFETVEHKTIIGKGGIDLIKAINEEGSIHKAAKVLNMSYSHASKLLSEINEILGIDVIEKVRGGSQGGGTRITKYGIKLVEEYENIVLKINQLIDSIGEIKID